jgi:hypothetical protein
METFIVRIYRGIPARVQELAGTVERVGSGDRVGFSGRDQLLDCLLAAGPRAESAHHPRSVDDSADPGEGR